LPADPRVGTGIICRNCGRRAFLGGLTWPFGVFFWIHLVCYRCGISASPALKSTE
jgi:ribosomal protein L37E